MTDTVISFFSDGTIEATRSPLVEQIFDGEGDMQRVTDIRKIGRKAYVIKWLLGPYAGIVLNRSMYYLIMFIEEMPGREQVDNISAPLVYSSYEAAVQAEIKVLNKLRLLGMRFNNG